MPEWEQITTRGPPALYSSAWVKWTIMDSDCSSCVLTMTYASPTPTFGRSPSTRFPGDTRAQSIATNWISSYSGVPLSRTFYTHALSTVRIATQTTPWCVARSGCNQRGSIAIRNRGTPVLMSARCHNQTSCHSLQRQLRESSVPHSLGPHSPKTLPQRSGKFSETPCTAHPSLPSGERPQRLTIGLMRSQPKCDPSSRQSAPLWLCTDSHPAKGTCRYSELPGARFNKPRGDVRRRIDTAQPGYTDSRHTREHQGNVRWH